MIKQQQTLQGYHQTHSEKGLFTFYKEQQELDSGQVNKSELILNKLQDNSRKSPNLRGCINFQGCTDGNYRQKSKNTVQISEIEKSARNKKHGKKKINTHRQKPYNKNNSKHKDNSSNHNKVTNINDKTKLKPTYHNNANKSTNQHIKIPNQRGRQETIDSHEHEVHNKQLFLKQITSRRTILQHKNIQYRISNSNMVKTSSGDIIGLQNSHHESVREDTSPTLKQFNPEQSEEYLSSQGLNGRPEWEPQPSRANHQRLYTEAIAQNQANDSSEIEPKYRYPSILKNRNQPSKSPLKVLTPKQTDRHIRQYWKTNRIDIQAHIAKPKQHQHITHNRSRNRTISQRNQQKQQCNNTNSNSGSKCTRLPYLHNHDKVPQINITNRPNQPHKNGLYTIHTPKSHHKLPIKRLEQQSVLQSSLPSFLFGDHHISDKVKLNRQYILALNQQEKMNWRLKLVHQNALFKAQKACETYDQIKKELLHCQ